MKLPLTVHVWVEGGVVQDVSVEDADGEELQEWEWELHDSDIEEEEECPDTE